MPLTKVQAGLIGGTDPAPTAFNPNGPIIELTQVISANYAITAGTNAISAGPITIANGVTLTVTDGSVWTVV
jgi:hypothetical protein